MHHPTDRIAHTTDLLHQSWSTDANVLHIPDPMAQWLCHRLIGWLVLGSHLGTGSNPERVFKDPIGRCVATTPSSLSLTSNMVTTNY